jgi:NAD(P)H-dependent flavin oxidoreductase YrpB (nitropropane dioxygenase family)
METRITKRFELTTPIVSAGMAFVSRPALAAAVSNAGGMGFLAAEMTPPHEVADLIRATRRLTSRPFGIECMAPYFTPWHLDACITEPVAVVTFLWGIPERDWVEKLQQAGSQVWVKIGSLEQARRAVAQRVDALVVEAPEGGPEYVSGRLMKLLADVADAVDIPVIASASAVDGPGLMAALMLGAEAVRCGTLFLGAKEANAEAEYARGIADSPIDATLRVSLLTREWPERPTPTLTDHVVREWIRSQLESKGPAWAGTRHARCRVRGGSEPRRSALFAEPDSSAILIATAGPCGSEGKSAVAVERKRGNTTSIPSVAAILEGIMNEAQRILQNRERLCQVA